MKSQTSTKSLRSKATVSQKGFALVATIIVMSMLMLLSVSMLTMSSVSTRSGAVDEHQRIAEANARMAAMIALGELQEKLGPDTRVTANVSVNNPSSPNKHWVSVYNTQIGEDVEKSVAGNYVVNHLEGKLFLTDSRNDAELSPITTLVSGDKDPTQILDDTNSVILLDTGDEETSVRAPLTKVKNSALSYWVSDNSVKAVYRDTNPYKDQTSNNMNADAESFYNASVAQSMNLDKLEVEGETLLQNQSSISNDKLEKAVSFETAELLFDQLENTKLNKTFHTITNDSSAVFANTQRGGLKRDLTPFIESGNINPTGADQNKGLEPLLEETPIIKGLHHNMTSPRFGVFKDWGDMRFRLDNPSGEATIMAQSSKESFRQGYNRSPYLKRRDLTNHKSNFIQPVVVEASLGWDFSPYGSGTEQKLRFHAIPRMTLWNPYNVSIKASNYILMMKVPHYGGFAYRNAAGVRVYYNNIANGQNFVGFTTQEVTLAPGESKVFSPDVSKATGSVLAGKAIEYDATNFANNVLSADNAPGVQSFYTDTNVSIPEPETAANRNAPYGFSGDSNGFYASNYDFASDEFIVVQSNDTNTNSITKADIENATQSKFNTVAHFIANTDAESRYHKWYAAERSNHAANGSPLFEDINRWSEDRLAPRLWRRGVRMLWFDEYAESRTNGHYSSNSGRLTIPLVVSSNLHGGLVNSPSPFSTAFNGGWQFPHMDSHIYFRQPTDPEEFQNFFPSSPIGKPSDGFPLRVVIYDVPRKTPGIFSLGQFQSAQFSYFPWHPSIILGSSYSTEISDLDATALRSGKEQFDVTRGDRWTSARGGNYRADNVMQRAGSDSPANKKHGDEVLIYDISYELNHSIWDNYMLSGIPYKGDENSRTVDWDGETNLPVSSYKLIGTNDHTVDEVIEEIKKEDSYIHYHAAEFLLNDGALNVNCDNKEVWKALLLSLYNKERPNLTNTSKESDSTQISRSLLPPTAGSISIPDSVDSKAWSGFRALTEADIDSLATEIVAQVRLRGPFTSVSDFINRRLTKSDPQISASGTLQAAIDQTEINQNIESDSPDGFTGDRTSETANAISSMANRVDYKTAGLPGYFSQNDLLTVIGPSLTARGDTFTIRAYGDSRDSVGNVKATAYCELVVQRYPDYVDSSDNAAEPVRVYDEASEEWNLNISNGGAEIGLSETNLKMGRKFRAIKFNWLPKP